MVLLSTKTKKAVTLILPQLTPAPEYPSDFFVTNPGKPAVSVPDLGKNLNELRDIFAKQVKDNSMTLDVAKAYLWAVFGKCGGVLKGDWVSFGVVIGNDGGSVTPQSLLEPKFVAATYVDQGKITTPEKEDKALMLIALCMYRLAKPIMPEYKTVLMTKIDNQLATLQPNKWKIAALQGMCSAWGSDEDYCKLVAAFDMFINKFSNCEYALVRIGTVGSRFRDCSALTSCEYITKLLGITPEEFCDWVFTSQVGEEIERMMRDGQEIGKADSYMPYLIDMGLSQRSPFSARTNSCVHLFIHMIGAFLGTQRSRKARLFSDAGQAMIVQNAAICAYAFSKISHLGKYFTPDGEEIVLDTIAKDTTDPTSTSGDEWFYKIGEWGNKVPPHIWNFAKQAGKTVSSFREGTIGEFISKDMTAQS